MPTLFAWKTFAASVEMAERKPSRVENGSEARDVAGRDWIMEALDEGRLR